jgi:hypothetical protein
MHQKTGKALWGFDKAMVEILSNWLDAMERAGGPCSLVLGADGVWIARGRESGVERGRCVVDGHRMVMTNVGVLSPHAFDGGESSNDGTTSSRGMFGDGLPSGGRTLTRLGAEWFFVSGMSVMTLTEKDEKSYLHERPLVSAMDRVCFCISLAGEDMGAMLRRLCLFFHGDLPVRGRSAYAWILEVGGHFEVRAERLETPSVP